MKSGMKISELIHAFFWPQYFTGRRSIHKSLNHLGCFDFPRTWRGNLMVPVTFASALIVIFLLSFLPSADFSEEAASVLSRNRRKLSLVSSQLII